MHRGRKRNTKKRLKEWRKKKSGKQVFIPAIYSCHLTSQLTQLPGTLLQSDTEFSKLLHSPKSSWQIAKALAYQKHHHRTKSPLKTTLLDGNCLYLFIYQPIHLSSARPASTSTSFLSQHTTRQANMCYTRRSWRRCSRGGKCPRWGHMHRGYEQGIKESRIIYCPCPLAESKTPFELCSTFELHPLGDIIIKGERCKSCIEAGGTYPPTSNELSKWSKFDLGP